MENEIIATANKYFKITPKSEQIETINSYMNNKDTVMVAPTGFGKSLIYQIAPLLFDKDNVYSQHQSIHNNNISRQEQADGQTTTDFTDTSTPVRPERVPQQSSVPEETEDVSTMMEAMQLLYLYHLSQPQVKHSKHSQETSFFFQQYLGGDNSYEMRGLA